MHVFERGVRGLRPSPYEPLGTVVDPVSKNSSNESDSATVKTSDLEERPSDHSALPPSLIQLGPVPSFADISTSDIQIEIRPANADTSTVSAAAVPSLPLHTSVLRRRSALFAKALINLPSHGSVAVVSLSAADGATAVTSPRKIKSTSKTTLQGSVSGAAGGRLQYKGPLPPHLAKKHGPAGNPKASAESAPGIWSLTAAPSVADSQAYATALRLLYCDESDSLAPHLPPPVTAQGLLDVLSACVDLQFDWGTAACLTHMEAVPWSDGELALLKAGAGRLGLRQAAAPLLHRLPVVEVQGGREVIAAAVRDLLATCTLLPDYLDLEGAEGGEGRLRAAVMLANPPHSVHQQAGGIPAPTGSERGGMGRAMPPSVSGRPVQGGTQAHAFDGAGRDKWGRVAEAAAPQPVPHSLPPGVAECRDAVAELLRLTVAPPGSRAAAVQPPSQPAGESGSPLPQRNEAVAVGDEGQGEGEGHAGLPWLALGRREQRAVLREAFGELLESVWGEEHVEGCEERADRYRQGGGKTAEGGGGGGGERGVGGGGGGVRGGEGKVVTPTALTRPVKAFPVSESEKEPAERTAGLRQEGMPEWLHGADGSLTWLLGLMLEHGLASDVLTWLTSDEVLLGNVKTWLERQRGGLKGDGNYSNDTGGVQDRNISRDKGVDLVLREAVQETRGTPPAADAGEADAIALHSLKVALLGTMGAVIAKRLVVPAGVRVAFVRQWLPLMPLMCTVNEAAREEGRRVRRTTSVEARPGRSFCEGFEVCRAKVDSEERAIILFGFNELVQTLPGQEQRELFREWLQMAEEEEGGRNRGTEAPRDRALLVSHAQWSIKMVTSPRGNWAGVCGPELNEAFLLPLSLEGEDERCTGKSRQDRGCSWFSLSGAYKGWLERQGHPC